MKDKLKTQVRNSVFISNKVKDQVILAIDSADKEQLHELSQIMMVFDPDISKFLNNYINKLKKTNNLVELKSFNRALRLTIVNN